MAAQSAVADEAALRMVFPRLVEELKASDVIDELYQKNLLEKNEYEGILDASFKVDSKDVTRRVLMAVGRRPAGFVPALVEVLNKKYRSLAAALEKGEHLVCLVGNLIYLASSFTQATMTPLRVLLLLVLQPWLT